VSVADPVEPALREPERAQRVAANRRTARLLETGPAVVLGLLGLVLGLVVGGPVGGLAGVVVGALVGWGSAVAGVRSAGRVVLRRVGARPVAKGEHPRYANIVEGICAGAGMAVPALYLADSPVPDALAVGTDPAHAGLVATTGLLEVLNRVELEGALAHELAHIRAEDTRVRTVAALVPALRRLVPDSEEAADVEAAMLTRYPPGLEAALARIAAPEGAPPGGPGVAPLWLAPPGAVASVAHRVAALHDL